MTHLTHGWEPELDEGDSLLRRFVLTNARCSVDLARRAGGRSRVTPAVSLSDPSSSVLFDNLAVLLQPPSYTDLDACVDDVLAFYPPERHFVLLSVWPTPDLSARGLQLMGHPPLMFRVPGGASPPLAPGLDIRRVEDAAALDDFVATLVEAYPMPGGKGTVLANPAILEGALRLFVGYADGKPVGTAGVRLGPGILDVEWVSTLTEVRGRGYGAALTWAATLVDPSWPAVLIASDAGQPVYERMGYVRLLRVTMWHRPGEG